MLDKDQARVLKMNYAFVNRSCGVTGTAEFMERRESERFPLMLDCSVTFTGDSYDVVLIDISAGGAKFQFKFVPPTPPAEGAETVLEVPRHGGFYGEIVWTDDDYAGMAFDENHKMAANLIHEMVAESRAAANE